MTENILQLPQRDALQQQVRALEREVAELFEWRDELLLVTCPAAEATYLTTLGDIEYRELSAEMLYHRLAEKCRLLRELKEAGAPIVLTEIEQELDEKFAASEQGLENYLMRLNGALDYQATAAKVSEQELATLQHDYQQISRVIHPHLYPEQSQARTQLFLKAFLAYEERDAEVLELLAGTLGDVAIDRTSPTPQTVALYSRKQYLKKLKRDVQQSIKDLKSSPGYLLLPYTQSEDALAEKRARLTEQLAEWENRLEVKMAEVELLLR